MASEKTKADYEALIRRLAIAENAVPGGGYFTDENVDRENVDVAENDPTFWSAMYSAAAMAAGMRAEDAGLNINKLLGEVIY